MYSNLKKHPNLNNQNPAYNNGRKIVKKRLPQKQEDYPLHEINAVVGGKSQPNNPNGKLNRYSIYTNSIRNSQQAENITKTLQHNRKSIELTNSTQPVRNLNTISQASRPVYRRVSHHQGNTTSFKQRYNDIISNSMANEDSQLEIRNKSNSRVNPYLKKQSYYNHERRNSILNRSNTKIRSGGNLTKQLSPYQLSKQPRSSLSQHYDPTLETSLHKRRQSHNNSNQGLQGGSNSDEKSQVLKTAKEFYKENNFEKCCDVLKKYLKSIGKCGHQPVEAYYLFGMSLINKSSLDEGIQALQKAIAINPYFKKTLYLILGLAEKRLGRFKDAIEILSKGLELYPEYYDCLAYRGKMFIKVEDYRKGRNDFEMAIQLNRKKGFAYLGKGTCELKMKLFSEAIETFNEGIKTKDLEYVCHEKRGICFYELKKYEEAFTDLEKATDSQLYNSPVGHFFKGKIFYMKKKPIEAILCFEEALKQQHSSGEVSSSELEVITQAIEMMLRIKIEEKDFYEASHIINRTENIPNIDSLVLKQWKMFLEGSLFMMKKKYKEGIEMYDRLEEDPDAPAEERLFSIEGKDAYLRAKRNLTAVQIERYEFLKPLTHLYKAFGYISESEPELAEVEYKKHSEICSTIGIDSGEKKNLSKTYNSLIISANKINRDANSESKESITGLLHEARNLILTKPQPYLFISFDLLNQLLEGNMEYGNDSQQASSREDAFQKIMDNLTIGISYLPQLSNNHISSFYYFRAIVQLYRHEFNKAVADVDMAIEKSEDNIPKYFYLRGLIFACFGNFSQSVQDLSVAINLDEKKAKPYLERAKCLQIEGNSNEAFIDLQKYITLSPEDPYIHKYAGFLLFQNCAYEDCLSAFGHGSEMPHDKELTLTKAKCNFLLGNYQLSIMLFRSYQEQIAPLLQFKKDITIIEICAKLNSGKELSEQQKGSTLLTLDQIIEQFMLRNQSQISAHESDPKKLLHLSAEFSPSNKIFKLRDMHQIKGSIYTLLKQYDKALNEFQRTLELFRNEKQKEFEKNIVEDSEEFEEQWSEIEIKYNISLILLCKGEYQEVANILAEFDHSSEKGKHWDKYVELVDVLINGKQVYLQKYGQKVEIDAFQQNHRISKLWERVNLPNEIGKEILLSLAFSYPFVEPPQMMPEFDSELFTEFDMRKVEPKPEAPWINRNYNGLVFTPNVELYDNLQLSMTTKKEGESSDQLSRDEKPISDIDNSSISLSNSEYQMEAHDLKKKFKLDSLVEMKLNKMMKGQNN